MQIPVMEERPLLIVVSKYLSHRDWLPAFLYIILYVTIWIVHAQSLYVHVGLQGVLPEEELSIWL